MLIAVAIRECMKLFLSVSLLSECGFVWANEQTKSEREEAVDSEPPLSLSLGVCVRVLLVPHTTHYHFNNRHNTAPILSLIPIRQIPSLSVSSNEPLRPKPLRRRRGQCQSLCGQFPQLSSLHFLFYLSRCVIIFDNRFSLCLSFDLDPSLLN